MRDMYLVHLANAASYTVLLQEQPSRRSENRARKSICNTAVRVREEGRGVHVVSTIRDRFIRSKIILEMDCD